MSASAVRGLCRMLVVSMMMLSFQSAWAGMIGTQQALASTAPAQPDRVMVQDLLSRAELQNQLRAMGVDPGAVSDRVATLTDQEVQTLAGDLQHAPAGGFWGWVVLAAVIIGAFMIWGSTSPRR